jgi:hypothetical protein
MLFKLKEEIEQMLPLLGITLGHTPITFRSRIVDTGSTFRVEYNPTTSPLRDNEFLKEVCAERRDQILRLFTEKLDSFINEKPIKGWKK